MEQNATDSRAAIIAAAYQELVEQGFASASMAAIAQAAGVTPAAASSAFAGKEELLLEVLRVAAEQSSLSIIQHAEAGALTAAADLAVATAQSRALVEPEWYQLRYEAFAHGLRNPAALPGLAALLAVSRRGISTVVRRTAGPSAAADAVAALVLACLDGLALQKLADPDLDLAAAYQLLGRLAFAGDLQPR